MVRRLCAIAVVMAVCLFWQSSVLAGGYVGIKTGAGAGIVGAELELPLRDRLSILLQGGVAGTGDAATVGGAIGLREYASSGKLRPFGTVYVGSIAVSYFSWYTGTTTVAMTYYGGTAGAKYERHNWYASGEIGYAYVPALQTGGLMFGGSLGIKF